MMVVPGDTEDGKRVPGGGTVGVVITPGETPAGNGVPGATTVGMTGGVV
jgi:hypothetical protein